MPFVADASIALAWLFVDEASPETDALMEVALDEGLIVPAHWPVEIGNAGLNAVRRSRVAVSDVAVFLALLDRMSIDVFPVTVRHAMTDLRQLSLSHGLTVYDAGYLDLALARQLPLATRDRALRTAAEQVGVSVLP